MPAPAFLVPLAWNVARVGAVAAVAAYAARRRRPEGPRDIWRERALDGVEEGLETDAARAGDDRRIDAAGRWRRAVRLGPDGPGLEFDLAALARLRLRRV